jgi:hypothetical protein
MLVKPTKHALVILAAALPAACAAAPQPQEASDSLLPPPGSANGTFVKNTRQDRFIRSRERYPNDMRMHGRSGQVLLAYSLTHAGAAERVEVLRSDNTAFTRGAATLLSDLRFSVPGDWDAQKDPQLRYKMEVQFMLHGMPRPQTWDPQATIITITGTSPEHP